MTKELFFDKWGPSDSKHWDAFRADLDKIAAVAEAALKEVEALEEDTDQTIKRDYQRGRSEAVVEVRRLLPKVLCITADTPDSVFVSVSVGTVRRLLADSERCERLEGALREIAQTMRADSESAQCAYQIATAALEVPNGEL